MNLNELKTLRERQLNLHRAFDRYRQDIAAFQSSAESIITYRKLIDAINIRLKKSNISFESESDALRDIESETITEAQKKELRGLVEEKNALEARKARAETTVEKSPAKNRKDIAETIFWCFSAGQERPFDLEYQEKIKNAIVKIARQSSLYKDVIYVAPETINDMTLSSLVETYESVKIRFEAASNQDNKNDFAVLMGALDTAVTQAWEKEVVSTIQEQQKNVSGYATKFHATEFGPSSVEYMRFHDENYEKQKTENSRRCMQLIALAEAHGNSAFMTAHFDSLSNSTLPEETKHFLDKWKDFEALTIREETREQLLTIDLNTPGDEYQIKLKQLKVDYLPLDPPQEEMEALTTARDKEVDLLTRKRARILARNTATERLQQLPGLDTGGVPPESMESERRSFALDSIIESLEHQEAPYYSVIHSSSNVSPASPNMGRRGSIIQTITSVFAANPSEKRETSVSSAQPNMERRPSIFQSLPNVLARKPSAEGELETSLLIGKTKVGDEDQYTAYFPAFGRAAFDTAENLKKFVSKVLEYMAGQSNEASPQVFEVN